MKTQTTKTELTLQEKIRYLLALPAGMYDLSEQKI